MASDWDQFFHWSRMFTTLTATPTQPKCFRPDCFRIVVSSSATVDAMIDWKK